MSTEEREFEIGDRVHMHSGAGAGLHGVVERKDWDCSLYTVRGDDGKIYGKHPLWMALVDEVIDG